LFNKFAEVHEFVRIFAHELGLRLDESPAEKIRAGGHHLGP
jgi:hypothetical protein